MDKIYSRPRIKIFYSTTKKNSKKRFLIIMATCITIATVIITLKSLNPIFENLCRDKAIQISTQILNDESAKVLKNHDYKDIVSVEKTEENNILKTNVQIINDIGSDIALQVTNKMQELSESKIKIPFGALFGNKYLTGFGPYVSITIIPSGTVITRLKTEFKEQGINQTVYRVYLEVTCNEKVLTSYNVIDTKITNQVLLVETVIIGNVPETYYNLEGIDSKNSIDIIE